MLCQAIAVYSYILQAKYPSNRYVLTPHFLRIEKEPPTRGGSASGAKQIKVNEVLAPTFAACRSDPLPGI